MTKLYKRVGDLFTIPTGEVSIGDINAELNTTGQRSLGQADGRVLAGVPSGQISLSDYQGKTGADFIINAGFYVLEEGTLQIEYWGFSVATEIPAFGSVNGDYQGNTILGFSEGLFTIAGTPQNNRICGVEIEGDIVSSLVGKKLSVNGRTFDLIVATSEKYPLWTLGVEVQNGNTFINNIAINVNSGVSDGNYFNLANGISYPVKII